MFYATQMTDFMQIIFKYRFHMLIFVYYIEYTSTKMNVVPLQTETKCQMTGMSFKTITDKQQQLKTRNGPKGNS